MNYEFDFYISHLDLKSPWIKFPIIGIRCMFLFKDCGHLSPPMCWSRVEKIRAVDWCAPEIKPPEQWTLFERDCCVTEYSIRCFLAPNLRFSKMAKFPEINGKLSFAFKDWRKSGGSEIGWKGVEKIRALDWKAPEIKPKCEWKLL